MISRGCFYESHVLNSMPVLFLAWRHQDLRF